MKMNQIIRIVAFVSLVSGLMVLPGSSGLTNQPFDITLLMIAMMLLVTGFVGLQITKQKYRECFKTANVVNLVSLLLILFASLMLAGDIYNARAYLYIIFILPGDAAGIWNNLFEFSFIFIPMATSSFTLLAASLLRNFDPVFIYEESRAGQVMRDIDGAGSSDMFAEYTSGSES